MDTSRRAMLLGIPAAALVALVVAVLLGPSLLRTAAPNPDTAAASAEPDMSRGKRRSGIIESVVVAAAPNALVQAPAVPASGFADQLRLGYTSGDQWEPAIAADRFGHVYILYAQYLGVPGCAECQSPTQVLQVSADHGATWSAPRPISRGEPGWDSQIAVDPVDGRTVWAAWLDKRKSDIVVARSDDFGATWAPKAVDHTNAGTDKPILAVRGDDVYVAYNHAQTVWVSSTHDGGGTWTAVKTQKAAKSQFGWSLAAGGTVAPNGDVHFSWGGYTQNGQAKGPVQLYVSTSRDGGGTWTHQQVDLSGTPPDCAADLCGWAYLGAQMTMTSDAGGTLYGLWNGGATEPKGGPERIWFARSTDGGRSWSARQDVSTAPAGVAHAFPAIVAGAAGDVRIAWMDARAPGGELWNVYLRTSTDGGATWSAETDISSDAAGIPYIFPEGFEYPFGDYFELDIDEDGLTYAIFGEGLNYDSPGSIWYTRGGG